MQLLEVVAHAHQNRIMLRDIKSNNIAIQPPGTLKLLDFGAAKMLGAEERYPNAVALKDDLVRQFPLYGTQSGRWPWTH